ncbi:hypothetical protein [Antiquaquibacter soli]|uniref:Tetratricopeptide repeat protein n=1 Tax=Antiquaquibacter soli TaxID=3064523 RepID=A0ABT9BUQ3_9MICO|nr:hypothetical protein [Protaetiibacter sp. WY-16]MDO7883511.1 hypothetical protein [Protaetiibacter sp. WY-16]
MVDIAIALLGLAARLFGWATLETRISLRVAKSAKQLGVPIHRKLLRIAISSPAFRDRYYARDEPTRRDVDLELAAALRSRSGDVRDVAVLRTALSRAYLTMLPGGSEALRHKDQLDEARTELLGERLSTAADDRALFDSRLEHMHPLRAREFRELRLVWDRTPTLLGLLSGDAKTQLTYWSKYPPAILTDAPADVFGVLANVAGDHDLRDVSAGFIERGLASGLAPAGYWMVRLMPLRGVDDRTAAAQFLSGFRGYPLAEAQIAEDGREAARAALLDWTPDHPGEHLLRLLLLGELFLADLMVDEAIATALEAVNEHQSTSAALLAARGMMTRSMVGNSQLHRYDISDGLVYARRARADCLKWGLPSGEALALILRLMRMLSDVRGALQFGSPPPVGSATPAEIADPVVVNELALLHAFRGDVAKAREMRATLGVAGDKIDAEIAERGSTDPVEAWERAMESTDDWGEKADIALQLAFKGRVADFLDEAEASNPEIVTELRLIASLFAGEDGAVERFRGFAASSFRGTLFLLRYYQENSDDSNGAKLAEDGARAWNDSDLWVESAKYKYDSGERGGAIVDLHNALVAAPPGWGGTGDTYRRIVEAYSALGKWHDARNAAAQLLAQDPDNPDSAWALIVCQLHTSDPGGALYTWRARGRPRPASEMQAGAWVELLRRFGDEFASPGDALTVAADWATNEEIRRALVVALFTGGGREARNAPDAIVNEIERSDSATLLQEYLRDFPDGGIWAIQFDENDPLGSLKAAIGDDADTEAIDESIFNGSLPAGFSGEVHGRGYLEVLIIKRRGPIHSGTRNPAAERAAITAAREGFVVLDTSAMHTRALLPDPVGDLLFGHFAGARAVAEQHRDAQNALERFRDDNGLSVRPGGPGEDPSVSTTSPEELARRLDVAIRAEVGFSSVVSVSHPTVNGIAALRGEEFRTPIFLALDYAVAEGIPLWSDDRVLRDLADGAGGAAFGTFELIAAMRDEGLIDPAELDVAEATLIAAGYTGSRFDRSVWALARGLDDGAGVSNAIRFANGDQVPDRVQFAIEEIEAHTQHPELLASATNAASRWILAIAGDDSSAARNLRLLWRSLLTRPWMNSSLLPFCLQGVAGLDRIADPIGVVLAEIFALYLALRERAGDPDAALMIFELVSLLPEENGKRVRGAIVTGSFDGQ